MLLLRLQAVLGAGDREGHSHPGAAVKESHHHRQGQQRPVHRLGHLIHHGAQVQDQSGHEEGPPQPPPQCFCVRSDLLVSDPAVSLTRLPAASLLVAVPKMHLQTGVSMQCWRCLSCHLNAQAVCFRPAFAVDINVGKTDWNVMSVYRSCVRLRVDTRLNCAFWMCCDHAYDTEMQFGSVWACAGLLSSVCLSWNPPQGLWIWWLCSDVTTDGSACFDVAQRIYLLLTARALQLAFTGPMLHAHDFCPYSPGFYLRLERSAFEHTRSFDHAQACF